MLKMYFDLQKSILSYLYTFTPKIQHNFILLYYLYFKIFR